MVELARRGFLFGAISSIILAPAVVKAKSLELVRGVKMTPWIDIPEWCPPGFIPYDDSKLTKQQFPDLHAWLKRCRQGGAHLSDDFKLGGESKTEWFDEYKDHSNRLNDPGTIPEIIGVRIVNVAPLKRANGSIAQPGMVIDHQIKSEIIKATQYEFGLPPEKAAICEEWKFVEKRPPGWQDRLWALSDKTKQPVFQASNLDKELAVIPRSIDNCVRMQPMPGLTQSELDLSYTKRALGEV